jgi:hypothetical protein
MAVPFADSKFLELVFLNKVCGLELRIVRAAHPFVCILHLLLHGVLGLESLKLLRSGRHDLIRRRDILLRSTFLLESAHKSTCTW